MKSLFITKNILLKVKKNIFYIFGLCAIVSFSTLYVFYENNTKYTFNLNLNIKDEFKKEISYIHLKKALYNNVMFDTPSLELNNLFYEFGESVKQDIENSVDCNVFLKHESKISKHAIRMFCKTTNKSEKFLNDQIRKIYNKNEIFYVTKYNQIVDIYLMTFVSKDYEDKFLGAFHIKNLSMYDYEVFEINNKRGLILTSLVFSIVFSLFVYLSTSLFLNLYYKK